MVSCVMMVRIAGATEGSVPVTRPEQRGANVAAPLRVSGNRDRPNEGAR